MSEYRLRQEMAAAALLKSEIQSTVDLRMDDDNLLRDVIEGETSLHEMIAQVTEELVATEGMARGLGQTVSTLTDRRKRLDYKAEKLREALKAAMIMGEIAKLQTPAATLSVSKGRDGYFITDVSAIPDEFLTRPEPVPNRRAIGDAVKDGKEIPGVAKSNPEPILTIRTA
jgi:hypothetical protein